MSLLRLNNDIIVKDVIQTYLNRQGDNDISIKCNNGIIYTNKLVLASWSGFWKDLLIGTGEEKQTIIVDLDIETLKKIDQFLHTGQVIISGPQENIDLLEGLELLLPDLELNDRTKLLLEDAKKENGSSLFTNENPESEQQGNENEKNDDDSENEKTDRDDNRIFKYVVKEKYICRICLKYFSQKQARDFHMYSIHSKDDKFSCKICDKKLSSEMALRNHLKTHNDRDKYHCPECNKEYKNKSDLNRHCRIKGHTYPEVDVLELPKDFLKCTVCKKKVHKYTMNDHMKQYHAKGSQIIKCHLCPFTTNRMDNFYRHERQIHNLHNRKFDAIFTTLETLGYVKCYNCNKKFTEKKEAEKHMIQTTCTTHTCNKCGKSFNQKSNLLMHMRDVHEKAEFSCQHCNKKFRQKRNLTRHEKRCIQDDDAKSNEKNTE